MPEKIAARKTEEDHIKAIGANEFYAAEAKAYFVVKQDTRLTGAEKIRLELAHEAALRATGFRQRIVPSKKLAPDNSQEFQDICDAVMVKATEAAKAEFEKHKAHSPAHEPASVP